VSPPIKTEVKITVPPALLEQLDTLVTEYALKHKEDPDHCRRMLEITALQRGIASLRKDITK